MTFILIGDLFHQKHISKNVTSIYQIYQWITYVYKKLKLNKVKYTLEDYKSNSLPNLSTKDATYI